VGVAALVVSVVAFLATLLSVASYYFLLGLVAVSVLCMSTCVMLSSHACVIVAIFSGSTSLLGWFHVLSISLTTICDYDDVVVAVGWPTNSSTAENTTTAITNSTNTTTTGRDPSVDTFCDNRDFFFLMTLISAVLWFVVCGLALKMGRHVDERMSAQTTDDTDGDTVASEESIMANEHEYGNDTASSSAAASSASNHDGQRENETTTNELVVTGGVTTATRARW
jgi:hypothetical protein